MWIFEGGRENIPGRGRACAKVMRPEQAWHTCMTQRSIWLEQTVKKGEWT